MAKTTKPTIGTYIDPLTDFAFKKLFGSEPNKDLLIDFLNGVFRGRKHIVDLVYNKNEHPGETVNEGGAIFDLTCTGNDGEPIHHRGAEGKTRQLQATGNLLYQPLSQRTGSKGQAFGVGL